jgi:hypothetical protein
MKLSVATLLHKPAICCNITHSQDRSGEHLNESSQARNLSFEAGGPRKEEEGRSQKKCVYKYEMLPRAVPYPYN